MDLKQMRCFLALAEEKHFGRAAARLHIVQPALSMLIKGLEADLGGPLFLRSSRHVELTESGRLLQAEAQALLERFENAELNIKRSMRGEVGRVRIGFAGNAVFSGTLGENMRAFHQLYPAAEIVVEELLPEIQLERILSGQLDLGYCSYLEGMPADPRLDFLSLEEWPCVLLICSGHRLAHKKTISDQDLQTETMVVYAKKQSMQQIRQTITAEIGFAPANFLAADSSLGVISLVTAGLGFTVSPLSMRAAHIPGLVMRPLKQYPQKIPLLLAYRKQEPGSAVRAYLNLLKNSVQSG